MPYFKNQKTTQSIKSSRHYYFNMIIHPEIGSNINLSTLQITSLVDFLRSSNFIQQVILESILFNLIITDRGRQISLKDFDGQLECTSLGIPYWNVYLQTTALITSRCLERKISQEIAKSCMEPNIRINPLSHFQRCDRKEVFPIRQSDFDSGHFSKTILRFEELLGNEQIIEAIKERPEKYKLFLETKQS